MFIIAEKASEICTKFGVVFGHVKPSLSLWKKLRQFRVIRSPVLVFIPLAKAECSFCISKATINLVVLYSLSKILIDLVVAG